MHAFSRLEHQAQFFKVIGDNGLADAYALKYDASNFEEGKPLETSFVLNGGRPVRYDFAMVNTSMFDVVSCEYKYKEARAATSDHALIVSELLPNWLDA